MSNEKGLSIIEVVWSILIIASIISSIFLLIFSLIFLIIPKETTLFVNEKRWERSIEIEEYKTVREDAWHIPDGGRLVYETSEVHHYDQVLSHYETITEEKMKSGTSAIMRGALGAAVLGPVGILAGLTAKNKEIHTIAIEWNDGEKTLIEVDEKIYKQIIKDLF